MSGPQKTAPETYAETMAERRAHILAELADGQPRYAGDLALDERYRFSTLETLMALEKEGIVSRLPLSETNMRRLWILADKEVTA